MTLADLILFVLLAVALVGATAFLMSCLFDRVLHAIAATLGFTLFCVGMALADKVQL